MRYTFDTLFMAAGLEVSYEDAAPVDGPWLLYGLPTGIEQPDDRCCTVAHSPGAWAQLTGTQPTGVNGCRVGGLYLPLGRESVLTDARFDIRFDLPGNSFYFLASCSERHHPPGEVDRHLYADSVFAKEGVPLNIVDLYLELLVEKLRQVCAKAGAPTWRRPRWPRDGAFALVLSHDVDFLPQTGADVAKQAGKTLARHLFRERSPADAVRAMTGLARALRNGRDPYGCVPDMIRREVATGVKASYQVAVSRRHARDVNYDIDNTRTRAYVQAVRDAGFDLCLHGSYRSTESSARYEDEVAALTRRFGVIRGSRQHFLSFNYDVLFAAQERSGIEYDMSIGFADHIGSRVGFSYPFFPFNLSEDRPYDVVQLCLLVMDVTLRGYMKLNNEEAWEAIRDQLAALERVAGCGSVVWHPIVFGGARDPGYDDLFWSMIRWVQNHGGLATDGASINDYWRSRAAAYPSLAPVVGRLRDRIVRQGNLRQDV